MIGLTDERLVDRANRPYAYVTVHLVERDSRFTGASVAGLVVGAMGAFVFAVALRHWLGERRRFREAARA
jgi:hypothetical protein